MTLREAHEGDLEFLQRIWERHGQVEVRTRVVVAGTVHHVDRAAR